MHIYIIWGYTYTDVCKQISTGACLKMYLAKSLPFSNDFPIKFPLVDFPWPRLPGGTKFQTHLDNCGDWLWLSDYKLLKEPLTNYLEYNATKESLFDWVWRTTSITQSYMEDFPLCSDYS